MRATPLLLTWITPVDREGRSNSNTLLFTTNVTIPIYIKFSVTVLLNWKGFHRTFAIGVTCKQRTLTPGFVPFGTCICSDQSFRIWSWFPDFEFQTILSNSYVVWSDPITTNQFAMIMMKAIQIKNRYNK